MSSVKLYDFTNVTKQELPSLKDYENIILHNYSRVKKPTVPQLCMIKIHNRRIINKSPEDFHMYVTEEDR